MAKMNRAQRRQAERAGLVPKPGATPAGTKRPPQPPRVVQVEAGYPEFGWRDELAKLVRDREALRRREDLIASQALAAGCTYSELARALGRSRQAVHARYRHLRPSFHDARN
jgi:hypothetical protein